MTSFAWGPGWSARRNAQCYWSPTGQCTTTGFVGPLQFYGALHARASSTARWDSSGTNVQLRGALFADGDLTGSLPLTVVYDQDLLTLLHTSIGTFAKLPGGWRDFR